MLQLRSDLEIGRLNLYSSKMNYKDLKIECVIRGMEFEAVTRGDFPTLTHWLIKNKFNEKNLNLLDEYDNHVEAILRDKGKEDLIHPSLRLNYISGNNIDEREENIKKENKKKVKNIVKKSKEKQKDKNGIIKHTKKSLTFKLQGKGYSIEKVIKRVTRRFPEANIKSIKIWYRKSERTERQQDKG